MPKTCCFNLAVIFLLLTFLCSCKKDEYYHMSEEFKAYTMFPIGSYWVYEELNSGFRDTLTVQDTSFRFESAAESNQFYECAYIDYNTKHSGKVRGSLSTITYNVNQCSSYSSCRIFNTYVGIDTSQNNQYMVFNNSYFCCCDKGWQNTEEHFTFSKLTDTLTISNKVYEDVMEFTFIPSNQMYPTTVKKSSFAKNVGLIRWELHNGDTWEIVDYKINN